MGQTCPTNCGVVVVRRVIIIAAVNGITLAGMRLFRPKRNLRVHPLDATTERFRGDFPKMFGFLYARYVGFATGIAILYCSQNKIESYPKAVYKTITPGNIEEFVL